LIKSFNYYKAYTLWAIGDPETAQKAFYANLELAQAEKDTSSMISTYYSLGQMYQDNGDLEPAEEHFLKILKYDATFDLEPRTIALTHVELSETYYEKKEYDKALKIVNNTFPYLKKHKLNVFLADVLYHKGMSHLALNEVDSARYASERFENLDESMKDGYGIGLHRKFRAKLYTTQKKYDDALNIYKKMIEEVDSIDFFNKEIAYRNAYEISKEMGDIEGAYNYLLAHSKIKKQVHEDEKKQKIDYLKIKFDSEQKEKDNAILSAQIAKKQTQQKLLYAFMAIFGLCFLGLFGAFYQKSRYNKKLEAQVVKRTQNLKESNDKLLVLNKERRIWSNGNERS